MYKISLKLVGKVTPVGLVVGETLVVSSEMEFRELDTE